MKYIFGPVPSRRLGQSLGIDPIPSKTCNYQCIYCQLGKTTNFTNLLQEFFPPDEILKELQTAIDENQGEMDYITLVGSGEPTLYKRLDYLIKKIKEFTTKPICVITNGALMCKEKVFDALLMADVVLPTLDAGNKKKFIAINRPHPDIEFERLVDSYIRFREQFSGEFWLEVMLMKGINDSEKELISIKKKLDLIKPKRIDINVPIRPPAEEWVDIPDKSVFHRLNRIFGKYGKDSEINFPEIGNFHKYSGNFEQELINIIERHPMREDQIFKTFCNETLNQEQILGKLKKLSQNNEINKMLYKGKVFWKKL
ncbi:MAG: radical SAM protein [Promethearchaeia archaeon]